VGPIKAISPARLPARRRFGGRQWTGPNIIKRMPLEIINFYARFPLRLDPDGQRRYKKEA
jgi:hypothetical protein